MAHVSDCNLTVFSFVDDLQPIVKNMYRLFSDTVLPNSLRLDVKRSSVLAQRLNFDIHFSRVISKVQSFYRPEDGLVC